MESITKLNFYFSSVTGYERKVKKKRTINPMEAQFSKMSKTAEVC